MKKVLTLLGIALFASTTAFSQDCFQYFNTEKGRTLEYTSYDAKGKVTSVSEQTVVDKKTENGKQIITYRIDTKPEGSDTVISRTFDISCDKDGTIQIDLGSMMQQSMDNGMTMEIDGGMTDFPKNPKAGQELEGTTMVIKMMSGDQVVMTINSTISNRKVEAVEKLTTPAGTFNCVVISYDVTTTIGFIKTTGHAKEWYAEKYGMVRSETYNKRNKLDAYQELTNIK